MWWPFARRARRSTAADGRGRTFEVHRVDARLDRIEPADPSTVWRARGVRQIEASDRDEQGYVHCEPVHGLVAAVHLAYAEHRPLALAPQDLWLCVLQAIARVLEAEPERYRSLFVSHQGRKTIAIRRDDFTPGSPDNDWAGAVDELASRVREETSDRARVFAAPPGASKTAMVACDVATLGAMQNYFELEVRTLCGIPSITLEGTTEQWASLRARTALLDELGLRDWRASLDAVLDQFIEASAGDVRTAFWREIYKREDASGGPRVSGWIHTLFPFLGERGIDARNERARYGRHWPSNALEGVGVAAFPPGLSSAPFLWQVLDERVPMSFVAGFVGASQDLHGVVRPRIGWAVSRRIAWRRFSIRREHTPSGAPTLYPRPGEKLVHCKGVADDARGLERWGVEFPFVTSLESFEGLEHAEGLVSIGTLSTRVRTLAPLEEHRTLERLWLHQDEALVDVRALRSLPALRSLAINHCDRLTDWSALFELEQLEELSLHGKTVPIACVGIHRGRDAVGAALAKLRASKGR